MYKVNISFFGTADIFESLKKYLQETFCPAFQASEMAQSGEIVRILPLDPGEGGHEITIAVSFRYNDYNQLIEHLEKEASVLLQQLHQIYGEKVLPHLSVMEIIS